jgi:hypothetical protein
MIYLIEHRTYQDGKINKELHHAVSSKNKAEEWMRKDEHNLKADDVTHCWFAVREIGIDDEKTIQGVDYYSCAGEPIDKQPINEAGDERRASQAGFDAD